MKYFFILGRNPQLSFQEVLSYFQKENIKINDFTLNQNTLLIDIDTDIKNNLIDELGGVISIGNILAQGSIKEILKELENLNLYFLIKNNFSFVLWNFSSDESYSSILEYLKLYFRAEKLKASLKPLTGNLDLQNGEKTGIVGNVVDMQYFIYKKGNIEYFGLINQNTDYKTLEKRDMSKPVRREELAISPRLSKIMINLSQVKKGDKILDPFCGIGVILTEALHKEIRVLGIDKDKTAIEGAIKNLEWSKFSKTSYNLVCKDSRKFSSNEKFHSIITEPELGKILKKFPSPNEAKKTQEEFENLICDTFNNFKNNISNRLVFSSPYILTNNRKRVGINIQNILSKTKLKLVDGFPIPDFRTGQIVGRQIYVLEK